MAAVIIDNGCGLTKVGLVAEDEPAAVFPTAVGTSKSGAPCVGQEAVGEGATWPLEEGVVTDWGAMEKVWAHALQQVGGGQQRPVLVTEAIKNPPANREKMAQLLFEEFKVPAMYVALQPVLSLYSTGRKTGVVLEVGHGLTQVVPVFSGFAVTEGVLRSPLAGAKITDYLRTQLKLAPGDTEAARVVKEALCYLTADPQTELAKDPASLSASHTLPDGRTITAGAERVRAPELLFNPGLGGFENDSLQKMLQDSVQKCEMDTRSQLYGNAILSGGSSMFPGMRDRLNAATPDNVKVIAPSQPDRKFLAWIGASILASMDEFKDMWVTKKEYEESGMVAVQKKCY